MNTNAPRFAALSLRQLPSLRGGIITRGNPLTNRHILFGTFQSVVKFDDAALTAKNILNFLGVTSI